MTVIQKEITALADKEYQEFQSKLIPNIKSSSVIGVRVPALRLLAKRLYSELPPAQISRFFDSLPHKYYEENLLHSFLIEQIKDWDECITRFEQFLPFIDNWAVCDTCHPKVFKKHTDQMLIKAKAWIKSDRTYTIRYGIDTFMTYFLDKEFDSSHLELVAQVKSDEYYVNMMQAWYYATALAKQWDDSIKIIQDKKLSVWVHNKTIQKARESFRVTDEHKEILLALKIKK